jgi:PAS domain S-box-containing protein
MRFISDTIQEISGYPAPDFINNRVRTFASIIHADDRFLVEKKVLEGTKLMRPFIIEYRIVNADGSIRWVYEKGQGIFDENGELLWLDGAIFDITERKKAEEERLRIDSRLRDKVTELSIMNEISEVLLSTRELNEILHMILIGATAHQALGFNRAFMFLINEEETMLEGEVATGSLSIEEAYKIWERLTYESHSLKELLQSRHGEFSKEDGPINNLVKQIKIPLAGSESIFSQSIYEKKSFNIADGKYSNLIEEDFLALLGTDAFALVPLVSRGKPLGVLLADNFINKKPINDEDVERLRAFANHASLAIESSHLYKSLEEKIEELSTAYHELRENRDKLIRYERLSAVGEVAAKITHEIKNPLVSIGGFARRILKKDHDGELNRNYVKIIVEEITRLENTLTDILYFAKPAVPKCDNTDLNRIVTDTIEILGVEIEKNNIRVEEHLDSSLPILWLDENQVRRVFMNLMRNAIQAMPEGGTVTVSTVVEHQWVKLETADTGMGIPDEDMDKLFDAFFTSKSTGSGLGLTVSAQIINNHGGTIEVLKRKPKGTCVIIKLPVNAPLKQMVTN